jgi:hypothetical protein
MAWQVQVEAYSLSALGSSEDFVSYHNAYARGETPVSSIPVCLDILLGIVLVFVHPTSIPLWSIVVIEALALVTFSKVSLWNL